MNWMRGVLTPIRYSLGQLQSYVNRPTRTRARMERAGFRFVDPVRVEADWVNEGGVAVRGSFHCVCGTLEQFRFIVAPEALRDVVNWDYIDALDPARALWRFGSFDKEHLLADGYTEQQADEIVAKFNGDPS